MQGAPATKTGCPCSATANCRCTYCQRCIQGTATVEIAPWSHTLAGSRQLWKGVCIHIVMRWAMRCSALTNRTAPSDICQLQILNCACQPRYPVEKLLLLNYDCGLCPGLLRGAAADTSTLLQLEVQTVLTGRTQMAKPVRDTTTVPPLPRTTLEAPDKPSSHRTNHPLSLESLCLNHNSTQSLYTL